MPGGEQMKAVIALCVFGFALGGASAAQPTACADLGAVKIPATTITKAETVPAGVFVPPGPPPPQLSVRPDYKTLPAFCRVAASIKPTSDSNIRFEVWLPVEGWNGKFMGTGNGGAAGFIFYWNMTEPLARGYAVANTDTGHEGTIDDRSFAMGHPEKYRDFGWRAVHEMTVASKAIVAAHYGTQSRRSYWNGCSTGGRQGLKEAQRFPEDYDGVIAGAPAAHVSGQVSYSILVQRLLTDPKSPLPPAKLPLLKEAAIAACDGKDGVADRVISEPGNCTFDPASIQCKTGDSSNCLTPAEVAAARRIYAGVVNPRTGEHVVPGPGFGSEPSAGQFASNFSIGTSHMRYAVLEKPDWDPFTFDFDADVEKIRAADGGTADAMNPDISAFAARGGKLLLYHGTTDGLVPYLNTVNYYQSVEAKLGSKVTRDHARLFLVPGMDHCRGGEGAFAIDYIGTLERWVEAGEAPDRMLARRPPGGTQFTRLVCAYPQVPRYKGAGGNTDAANWECVAK
jgi:feruloyl esterase